MEECQVMSGIGRSLGMRLVGSRSAYLQAHPCWLVGTPRGSDDPAIRAALSLGAEGSVGFYHGHMGVHSIHRWVKDPIFNSWTSSHLVSFNKSWCSAGDIYQGIGGVIEQGINLVHLPRFLSEGFSIETLKSAHATATEYLGEDQKKGLGLNFILGTGDLRNSANFERSVSQMVMAVQAGLAKYVSMGAHNTDIVLAKKFMHEVNQQLASQGLSAEMLYEYPVFSAWGNIKSSEPGILGAKLAVLDFPSSHVSISAAYNLGVGLKTSGIRAYTEQVINIPRPSQEASLFYESLVNHQLDAVKSEAWMDCLV